MEKNPLEVKIVNPDAQSPWDKIGITKERFYELNKLHNDLLNDAHDDGVDLFVELSKIVKTPAELMLVAFKFGQIVERGMMSAQDAIISEN